MMDDLEAEREKHVYGREVERGEVRLATQNARLSVSSLQTAGPPAAVASQSESS